MPAQHVRICPQHTYACFDESLFQFISLLLSIALCMNELFVCISFVYLLLSCYIRRPSRYLIRASMMLHAVVLFEYCCLTPIYPSSVSNWRSSPPTFALECAYIHSVDVGYQNSTLVLLAVLAVCKPSFSRHNRHCNCCCCCCCCCGSLMEKSYIAYM